MKQTYCETPIFADENDICYISNGYKIKHEQLPEKMFVLFKLDIPQDENIIFNRFLRSTESFQKAYSKILQFVRSKHSVQTNLGRIIELEREGYLSYRSYFYESLEISYRDTSPYLPFFTEFLPVKVSKSLETELRDPYKEFLPSKRLIEIVGKHLAQPNEEVQEMIKSLTIGRLQRNTEIESQRLADMITQQVEGLMTNLAKRSFIIKKPVLITTGGRFTPEICSELIRRLGLDPLNPYPVLNLLYEELIDFVSAVSRQRNWGQIVFENSELKLTLKQDPFIFPDLKRIEADDKWLVT